jgi:hypothetical protein
LFHASQVFIVASQRRSRCAEDTSPVVLVVQLGGSVHPHKANINLALDELPFLGGAKLGHHLVEGLGVALRDLLLMLVSDLN